MKKLRFVLVGTGNIATTYVRAAANVEEAEIVGVVSRSAERAARYAADNGFETSAVDLASVGVPYDAVMLATPNGLHHRDTLAAAALGKHVLTEKPLDVTLPKMDEMIAVCREAGVRLGVSFQRRMSPANIELKRMLDARAFGKIYVTDLFVKFLRPQSYYDSAEWRGTLAVDGGGPFMQQASHNVDTLTWFFGLPRTVMAKTARLAHHGIEVEDHGTAVLTWPDGMFGTIIASTVTAPGFPVRMELHSEKGSFVTVNDEVVDWKMEGVTPPAVAPSKAIHSGAGAAGVAVTETGGHEAIIRDFCHAVWEGRDPVVSGEQGRATGLVIDSIYRAAREGREITL